MNQKFAARKSVFKESPEILNVSDERNDSGRLLLIDSSAIYRPIRHFDD